MFAIQRSDKIIELLHQNNIVYVRDLVELFDVSDVTIRKDLNKLAKQGVVTKTHGGAILTQKQIPTPHTTANNISTNHKQIKDHLAKITYTKISHGDTIYLGSGYTCTALAGLIQRSDDICVITNNIEATLALRGKCRNLILLGGEVVEFESYTFTASNQIEHYLKAYNINVAITSSSAIDKDYGVSFSTEVNLRILSTIKQAAYKWYLMVDHSKFGRVSPYKVADINEVTEVITDKIPVGYQDFQNIHKA